MDLEDIRIFVKVADLASFTRAAEQLGMPKARVSTGLQRLETQLGTRLLLRTTRTVRMSPDGEQFVERLGLLFLVPVQDFQRLVLLLLRESGRNENCEQNGANSKFSHVVHPRRMGN